MCRSSKMETSRISPPLQMRKSVNIKALCAAPPSQMPLSCPVAPPSQRELHKDGSGGGGGIARRARAARAPKARSCATSSATPCAASFKCSSFMCHLRAGVGKARVRVVARRSIPFFAPGKAAFAAPFACSSFTCRPSLPLGLPHQQRASNAQRALGDKETVDEEARAGVGVGGS